MKNIKLKQRINDQMLTQREVANAIGLTETTISRYVNGTRTPDIYTAMKIADVLNDTVYHLWESEGTE